MHKIVVLDGYTLNPGDISWDKFSQQGTLKVYDRTSLTNYSEIIDRIADHDIVLTNKTPLPKDVFDVCQDIKYVGVLATGYNVVDVEYAKQRHIPVTNIPSYGTNAVGQFAIALLLEICHHIGHHSQQVANGVWQQKPDFCFWDYPLIELAGKTMGIIGFGRIGQATGRIARALGMQVLANDSFPSATGREIAKYVDLDELLSNSDVISLHCPLLASTKGLICKATIDKMKDGVIILNNSRGPLIIEEDLAEALNSGKVYAAGVDVVSSEPIGSDNPLLKAKNCIITPHISWASRECRVRLMNMAADNLQSFLLGHPVNVVNAWW